MEDSALKIQINLVKYIQTRFIGTSRTDFLISCLFCLLQSPAPKSIPKAKVVTFIRILLKCFITNVYLAINIEVLDFWNYPTLHIGQYVQCGTPKMHDPLVCCLD